MPPPAAKAPLYRPKSKLRLRLGPASSPNRFPSNKQHAGLPSQIIRTELEEDAFASFPPSVTSITSSSTANAPSESLNASTNTTTTTSSAFSRADSRDAFAIEISPSTASEHQPHPAFDTISYTSSSPISTNFPLAPSPWPEQGSTAPPSANSSPSIDLHAYQRAYANNHDESPVDIAELYRTHPHLAETVEKSNHVFYLRDSQLANRFHFIQEIGFGNWGTVWECKPLRSQWNRSTKTIDSIGRSAAAEGGARAGGRVAMKIVHREKDQVTAMRVKALWGELKIIRCLMQEPHPSIIQFESFVVTPSYALIIMPFLSHLIPVRISPIRAVHYFRQLASAVGYLHERSITHNDIKPANILISFNDVPVLIDFGFAEKWDLEEKNCFLSNVDWGTPEYLDPLRAAKMPHDERASDVWSLGITFYEILIGRTPFEYNDTDEFETVEQYYAYWERSRTGQWYGKWSMPGDLENLIRSMVCVDPAYRVSAIQAYHHPALQLSSPSAIVTPHFVRAAAMFDPEEELLAAQAQYAAERIKREERKKHAKKRVDKETKAVRSATPALGESIKQHTSAPRVKVPRGDYDENEGGTPSPKKKSVIVSNGLLEKPHHRKGDDITPTKVTKPAQPLLAKEATSNPNKKVMPRTSASQLTALARPPSSNSFNSNTTTKGDNRASVLSSISAGDVAPKDKEQAVLRTMRSLEGTKRIEKMKSKDRVMNTIRRPAPSPPRPKSLDSELEKDRQIRKEEQRRSLGIEKLMEVKEESPARSVQVIRTPTPKGSPAKSPRNDATIASPPRPRVNTRPTTIVMEGRPFPANGKDEDPLHELREKILSIDKDNLDRYRKVSGDLIGPRAPTPGPRAAKSSRPPTAIDFASIPDEIARFDLPSMNSNGMGLEGRLDKFALWVKDVERIVEDAKKAIAEGREPPLPSLSLPQDIALPTSPPQAAVAATISEEEPLRRFGVTPEKPSAVPAHLRTSSTQVEPATPPRWIVDQEAERQQVINEEEERKEVEAPVQASSLEVTGGIKKAVKKERPSVSHVLKLFGAEREKAPSRTNTPEPASMVPLKGAHSGPTLRGAPSTPALRSTTVRTSKNALTRRSESNLRNFNTMPTLSMVMSGDTGPSPRRAVYEDLLDSTPGVIRQGDGWSSLSRGEGMGKPSSIASLRERALAFLRDDNRDSVASSSMGRNIVDLASEVDFHKRNSRGDIIIGSNTRPATPGVMPLGTKQAADKKGILGRLKGFMGKKGMEKVDEAL